MLKQVKTRVRNRNFLIDFKIYTGFFFLFFCQVRYDLLIMSDVYKFLLESQPAPNQANQAKTHYLIFKITSSQSQQQLILIPN